MRRLILDEPRRVAEWVFGRVFNRSDDTPFTAMGLEAGGELIAGVVFNCYTGADVTLTFAAEKGKLWGRRQWVASVFAYVFEQMGCIRCSVDVAESNPSSMAVIEGLGFTQEGVKRCAATDGSDVRIYGMLRRECPYLRLN